jgi:uncharacterized protein Yka (UPF0111/DUF47 family)
MPFIDRLVKTLLPKEEHFFDLLEKGADVAVRAGGVMKVVCSADAAARTRAIEQMRDIEHEADGVIHEVYDALNRTFVTPIDRSDIYALATQLEDVVDLCHATAMQIVTHAMEDIPDGAPELADLIVAAASEARAAVGELRSLKNLDEIRRRCTQMSRLEHDGDEIFRRQIGLLFKNEKNAVHLIQHKEFLEGLEAALDACDHTGKALTAIVIKNG